MPVLPLIGFGGFLLLYSLFIAINLWHLHTYRVPGEPPHRLLYVLIPLMIVLLLMSLVAFTQVPWNSFMLFK